MRRFANDLTVQKSCTISNAINRVWDYRIGVQPQTRKETNLFYL